VTTIAFHLSTYALSRYLLRSPLAAITASGFLLVSGLDGFSYSIPSDLPIRFLLSPFVIGVSIAIALKPGARLFILIGLLDALATGWQTDTGLYCLFASLGFSICLVITGHKHWSATAYIAIAFVLAFPLIVFATDGDVTIDQLRRLLEPILLYSGGFGGVAMQWHTLWSRAYNILTPTIIGCAGALGIWAIWTERQPNKTAYAMLLLAGFAFMAIMKWVNRSIDVVWWLNAWPILLILALWWQIAAERRSASENRWRFYGHRIDRAAFCEPKLEDRWWFISKPSQKMGSILPRKSQHSIRCLFCACGASSPIDS
jgi:hypothetical protein